MKMENFLPCCPYCGKIDLPPNAIVISASSVLPPIFCEKTGPCARVECVYCNFRIDPQTHDWQECNWLRTSEGNPLQVEDVLGEAERILRKGQD